MEQFIINGLIGAVIGGVLGYLAGRLTLRIMNSKRMRVRRLRQRTIRRLRSLGLTRKQAKTIMLQAEKMLDGLLANLNEEWRVEKAAGVTDLEFNDWILETRSES